MKTNKIMKGITLLAILTLAGCGAKEAETVDYGFKIDVPEKYQSMEVEYGSKQSLEDNFFIYASGQVEFEIPSIDTKKMGDTEYEVKRTDGNVKVKVTVKDTKAPEFQGEDSFTITEGDDLDLASKVKAIDPVDGDVEVKFDKSDFSEPGEYEVTAKATDVNGNESTKKIKVIVEEKPAPEPVQQPNYNTNSGGSQSSSNNSSSNSGGGSSNSGSSNSGGGSSNSGSTGGSTTETDDSDDYDDDLVYVNIPLEGGTIHSYAVYSSDMVGIYITKNDGSGISYLWRGGQLSHSHDSSPLSGSDHARILELVQSWI